MKTIPGVIASILVLVLIEFCSSDYLSAQPVVILDTLAYTQISNFTDVHPATRIRTNADGSKLIFTGNYKQIFTMNSDGSNLIQVFDYETFRPGTPPYADPFVDISGDGSTILWTDGANEIFTANFNGGNAQAIATLIPNEPPFGPDEPDIRLSPRITYDGSKVFFIHISRNPNIAGLYTIASNGSGLTKLFSYTDMSINIFGLNASEFNRNTAFTDYLDISDDGSKGVFVTHNIDISTGHTLVFNNSSLSLLRNYAPARENPVTGIGQLSMSRDGNRVAMQIPDQSGWLNTTYVMDSDGDNQIELPFVFSAGSRIQLDSTGSNAIVIYHFPEHGGSEPFPVSYIDIDSLRILDLTVLEGNLEITFRGARSPVCTYDAKTVYFINYIVREDSLEQIWKLDINPDTLIDHPGISDIYFNPNYALFDHSNSSTFRATVAQGSSSLLFVNWDTFKEGGFVFRGLRTFGTSENLVDDGTLGDTAANDGIYSREGIFADLLEPPATLTIRIHADAGKYITSVDATPFYIWEPGAVSVEENSMPGVANRFKLYGNYPNPFNPSTTIRYQLSAVSDVNLAIFNIYGQLVRTLVRGQQPAGNHIVQWNGRDEAGRIVSSGLYIYRLQAGDQVQNKRLLLMK